MNTNFIFAFSLNTSFEQLDKQLKNIVLPSKVFIENEKIVIWGYFSSYTPLVSEGNLAQEIEKYGFRRIANSDCEYLLFVFDKQTKKLRVGVDNVVSISCYFAILGSQIVFSSDFSVIKDMVSRHMPLIADLDGVLTYITNGFHMVENTILESVKMIPVGSVAEFVFESEISYRISSFIDIDGLLSSLPKEEFRNDKEFAKALELSLTDSLARRLAKIPPGTEIGCEISSGFDCTLVAYILAKLIGPKSFYCYSFYFPEGYGTESLKIIRKFADKHSLQLKAVKLEPEEGYAQDYFSLWQDDSLLQFEADYFGGYIRFLKKHHPALLFTGQHGDETYSFKEWLLAAKYNRQMNYFDNVMWLKKENQAVLYTEKALNLLLNRERFNSRGRYPSFYSDIHLADGVLIDQMYRKFGVRQISPYLDLTVLSVGLRRGLREEKIPDEKQIYFRYLDHIFIPEMFIPKKGGTEFALGFPRNQKKLILWVMKNSVLGQYGMIDPKKIMQMVNDENSILCKDEFVALAFEYLVRADWYLIKNNIKLPI